MVTFEVSSADLYSPVYSKTSTLFQHKQLSGPTRARWVRSPLIEFKNDLADYVPVLSTLFIKKRINRQYV